MMPMLQNNLHEIVEHLIVAQKKKNAQIHCITNFVTANLCANAILAVNASPIMADAPEESAMITSHADALMVNLGTLSKTRKMAMLLSVSEASKKAIPIVLDPVGIGASLFRKDTLEQIVKTGKPTVIKGNLSEISALINGAYSHGKIDSDKSLELLSKAEKCQIASSAAQRYQCIVVMTGNPDIVSDGHHTMLVHNGHPMLKKITGTGCLLSALIATYCAYLPEDHFMAAMLATSTVGYCGEIAAHITLEKSSGTGTFEIELLNALSTLDYALFEKGLHYDDYTQ